MNTTNFIIFLIGDIILSVYHNMCWKKLLKKEEKIKITDVIIVTLIINVLSYILNKPIRLITVSLLLILFNVISSKATIRSSTLIVMISQLIVGLLEFSFIALCSLIMPKNWENFMTSSYSFILINVYILAISLLILKTKIPNKIYDLFNTSIEKDKNKETMINIIFFIAIMVLSTIESYQKIPITIVVITNIIIIIIFILNIVRTTMMDNKYTNINNKYQISITSLKEYETMIDKFRVNTHENKNELLTIRNMVKDKKVIEYIDALVDNKIKDNEKIMYQTSKIPEGGLRATIYSKLCVMDKYKIKYKLDISKDVRTVDLINLEDELVLNICKILGVFLDNAIEAVEPLKKKNINIELYVIDNKLYIDITNNYEGNIDLSKIGQTKQTSKGNEHGYGLLLVSKIINENSKYLENEKSINGSYFTQSLIIKLK